MKAKKYSTEINKLCERCKNKCKQDKEITLLSCPKFKAKPQQLTLNFKIKKLD